MSPTTSTWCYCVKSRLFNIKPLNLETTLLNFITTWLVSMEGGTLLLFLIIFMHIQWWPPWPSPVKNLNISFKCCSKCKSRDSFGNCSSWGCQNTPNMLRLIEFWLRYLRSKTNDMILKSSSKLIEIDKNLIKSIHFVSKVINSTFKTSHWPLKNDSSWHWCPQK